VLPEQGVVRLARVVALRPPRWRVATLVRVPPLRREAVLGIAVVRALRHVLAAAGAAERVLVHGADVLAVGAPLAVLAEAHLEL